MLLASLHSDTHARVCVHQLFLSLEERQTNKQTNKNPCLLTPQAFVFLSKSPLLSVQVGTHGQSAPPTLCPDSDYMEMTVAENRNATAAEISFCEDEDVHSMTNPVTDRRTVPASL